VQSEARCSPYFADESEELELIMANKVDRINRLIDASRHHREQLEAMAIEFATLHNAKPGSCDEDDLIGVILDGDDYKYVMLAIRRRHANTKRRKK
jgi:hypothetical protein